MRRAPIHHGTPRLRRRRRRRCDVDSDRPIREGGALDRAAFVEIFCECPLETLIERDVKGLYKKALSGEIKNFTGVSDPYESPENPEVVIHSGSESEDASLGRILLTLEKMELIPAVPGQSYDEDEEAEITKRLSDLGYI